MGIQIFGAAKCFDTRKAERYFKERRIKYQLVDLFKYGLSKGELSNVMAAVGLNNLFNENSTEYKRLNLQNIGGSNVREEILLKNPRLFKTPIVRNGKQATVGYKPDVWKNWE
jgi:arsenate reductase (glutaredoxin)